MIKQTVDSRVITFLYDLIMLFKVKAEFSSVAFTWDTFKRINNNNINNNKTETLTFTTIISIIRTLLLT